MGGASHRQVVLYRRLLGEIGGGYGRQMKERLGVASIDVYRALRERLRQRAPTPGSDTPTVTLDVVDWAAIRVLAPMVLELYDEGEFRTITGFSLQDAELLLQLARSHIRESHLPPGFITCQIGECLVRLPREHVADSLLIGVPDDASWDRVVPECARGRKSEFMSVLQDRYGSFARWIWEEREAASLEDLETFVRSRRPGPRSRGT